MDPESNDVNSEAASSTVSIQTDAISAPAASTSATRPSLDSVLADAYKKSLAKESAQPAKASNVKNETETEADPETETEDESTDETSETEEQKTEEDLEPAAETDETTDETDSAKDETSDTSQKADKGPIPYKRFAEVNSAKVALETQLRSYQPIIEAHNQIQQYCDANGITPDRFRTLLEREALAQVDPERALALYRPELDQLQALAGEALTPELQQAVTSGEISLEYAKRIAKAEGRSRLSARQAERAQEVTNVQRAQQHQQQVHSALSSFISNKKGSDPDFAPKTSASEPDGKYELFLDRLGTLARNQNAQTVGDYVRIAQEAYTAINATMKRFVPRIVNGNGNGKIKGSNGVRSSQASATTPVKAPKSLEEAVANRLKQRGISFTPTSKVS